MNDQLSNALNLATIANWIMIIGIAVLVYVSRIKEVHRKSHRPTRRVKIVN